MSLDGRLEVFFGAGGAGTGHHKRLDSIAVIEAGAATGRRDFGSDLTKRSSEVLPKTVRLGFSPLFCSIVNSTRAAAGSDVFIFGVEKMKRKKEKKTLKSSTL